ncbi:MAG: pyridoxal phosphate-dependent aminotransferase [Saprospiraceae bacterium]
MNTNIFSQSVKNLAESETLKMAQLARNLREQGIEVIDLSLGEPDFDTPEDIKNMAKKALDEGHTKYTPVNGIPLLRQAIVDKLKRDNGIEYNINNIVVSNGAKQAIANVCLTFLNPGDEVIIFAPYWVSYISIVKFSNGTPIIVDSTIENDFKVIPEELEKAITDKTKLVLFSSPGNPTGSVYTKSELKGLVDVLIKYPDIYIISDEIYEYISFDYDHVSIASFPEIKDRVILINGMSKGFSMTGWRLGYMAADIEIAKACTKIQGQSTSNANSIAQYASVYALNHGKYPEMSNIFKERRDIFVKLMKEIPNIKVNIPQAAFFLLPDFSYYFGKTNGKITIKDDVHLSELFLSEIHIATVSGSAFGSKECVRFSYATSIEQLTQAVVKIKNWLMEFH